MLLTQSHYKIFFVFIIFLVINLQGFSYTGKDNPKPLQVNYSDEESSPVTNFRDMVYLDQSDDETLYNEYNQLSEEIENMPVSFREKQFNQAISSFYLAKGIHSFKTTEEVLTFDKFQRRQNFIAMQNVIPRERRKTLIGLYDHALQSTSDYLDINRDSRGVWLYSEILGISLTLKPLGYLMVNGPKMIPLVDEAFLLDPNNVKAQIKKATRLIYTPKSLGGNPVQGIQDLLTISTNPILDREDRYTIAVSVGYGHTVEDQWSEAKKFYELALKEYPTNIFATAMISLSKRGGH